MESDEVEESNNNNENDNVPTQIMQQGENINWLLSIATRNVEEGINNATENYENEDFQEDGYEGGFDIFTSVEDTQQESGSRTPKLSQWKEEKPQEASVIVTIAKARRRLWAKAKEEIRIMKKNITDLPIIHDPTRSEIHKVFLFLFGPNGALCDTFCRELTGLEKKDYLRFLITYFTSCQNQMSLPLLHFSKVVNSEMLMEVDVYNLLWARIGALSGTRRKQAFWMSLEETTNSNLKCLFMSADDSVGDTYLIGLDDDKVHFNYRHSTDMNGLKNAVHVKDNRRGFTLHTAALSATCVPLSVMFQREQESVQATYMRILKYLFGNERGEAAPDLRGVTLASDRGYWKPGLVFDNVLECGGNIEGTVQRVSLNCAKFVSN